MAMLRPRMIRGIRVAGASWARSGVGSTRSLMLHAKRYQRHGTTAQCVAAGVGVALAVLFGQRLVALCTACLIVFMVYVRICACSREPVLYLHGLMGNATSLGMLARDEDVRA